MSHNRRDFLVRSTCAALGAAAFQGTIKQFGLANLLAVDGVTQSPESPNCSGGYKALVCIFLNGGNDGNNMVIPYDTTYYNPYAACRPGLAIPQANLTPMNNPPSMLGRQFAFHPNMPELTSLFNQNKLAVVTNVGTLVEPTSQSDYISGAVPKPFSLFSHSDQVQAAQTAKADSKSATGWGGRTVDAVLSCNAGSNFPTWSSRRFPHGSIRARWPLMRSATSARSTRSRSPTPRISRAATSSGSPASRRFTTRC